MNFGIIGFGKMGQIRYKTIIDNNLGEVTAIAETDVKILKNGYPRIVEIEKILENAEIDAVIICTPNYLNKELTIKALKNRKHVFCEKPPAFTSNDIIDIMEVERESDKKLMYGFNHRHHDSIIKAKRLVESGHLGKLLWMRGRYGKSVDENFFSNWRAKKELAGGGILIDQGIHMLDLFLNFAGDFEETHAFVSNLYWNLKVEDNVFAIFRNKQGVVASLHSTMTQWRHLFSLEIFLEKGYIVINGILSSSKTYGREIITVARNRTTAPAATWENEDREEFTIDNSWLYEMEHFINCIKRDTPVIVGNSNDALKIMRLIDKIYENN
ncbi:MAG: Gfo/Idh/MocA family protein [Ignavibacteriaceae bacterium]